MSAGTDSFGAPVRPGCDSAQEARAHMFSAAEPSTRGPSGSGAPASATSAAEPLKVSVWQLQARARKARAIAEWLYDNDYRPEGLSDTSDEWWAAVASEAGQHAPSEATRAAVVSILTYLCGDDR